MRTLVTGGAGFIGSNLVDALLDRGDAVAVIDDFSTGRRANLEPALRRGVRVHEADIRDREAVERIVEAERPEALFHLAAQIDVRRSVAMPAFDVSVNVEGTVNLLEAARASGVGRFVYSSTGGAIYGEADRIPAAEDTAIRPLSPYGQSKFAAEGYGGLYARLHGLSVVSLRYGNVYGPRQDPLGEAGVIAIFCGHLADGASAIVYGDGRQTRDYVYVGDVVAANLAAAGCHVTGSLNVGTGEETTVLELVAALERVSGGHLPVEHAPERPGEVLRSALDPAAAHERLGWRAQVGLEEGLRRTLAAA